MREKQKTFLREPRQFPLLFVGKTGNLKAHLRSPQGRRWHRLNFTFLVFCVKHSRFEIPRIIHPEL